jgi:cell wall-associated NlpC family hydrolase
MASPLCPARRRNARSRTLLALLVIGGVALSPLPASAEPPPGTSREAAELVAARAHDLEVLTERFNEAREELAATRRAAEQAAADLAAAEAALGQARDQVRAVAYSAFTGERLGSLEAMLTSDSPADLLDRVGMLRTIAEHNDGVLADADEATHEADRAQAAAERAAADAQAQVERLAAQQETLDEEIAAYQAEYERLSAAEQRASRAAAERHAAEEAAAQAAAEPSEPAEQADPGTGTSDAAPPPAPAPAPAPVVPAPPAPVAGGSAAAQVAVSTAMAQLGDPYVWAAAGPDAFDCSGLTQYAYAAAGIQLPHSSSMQSTMGTAVPTSALQPGDLLFFYSPVSHVGMYIGNGQMVHASTYGEPVKVASIDSMGSLTGARRIAG